MVPTVAVQRSQNGNYVFVVKDGVSKVRPVKVDRTFQGYLGDFGRPFGRRGRRGRRPVAAVGRIAGRAACAQGRGVKSMTLSELCIRRPVMTTLITASIIAFGVFGFRLLPVSALPRVDFPTIAVTATLPGASADTMAASVAGIIERQLSTICRHLLDVVELVAGHQRHHHPVRPQPQHRCRRARRADRADDRAAPVADRNDDPAELPQGEPGRLPGAVRLAEFGDAAAVDGQRIWRHHHRPGAVADSRRRPGPDLRRAEIRHPRPGRSRKPPRRAACRSTISATAVVARQFLYAGRNAQRAEAGRRAAGLRPDGQGGRLQQGHGRLASTVRRSSSTKSPISTTASRTTRSRPG